MSKLVRKVFHGLGFDIHRLQQAPVAGNAATDVCAAMRVPMLTCLPRRDYDAACPPLFPVPTPVPTHAPRSFYPGLREMLFNISMEQYFRVTESAAGFALTDVYTGSHHDSRQRMLATAYTRCIGPTLAGASVLDIGCSSGYYSFYAARMGANRVLGVDARPEHADQFTLLHGMLGLDDRCVYRHLDMEMELETMADTFDVVLAQGVMYHVYDHPRFIKNLKRLTRRLLVLEGGCSGRPDHLCKAEMEKADNLRASIHGPVLYPSLPWMVELLRWAGFRDVRYMQLPEGIPDTWGFAGLHRAMLIAVP